MTVDPLARQGFRSADAYEQGRPGYPPPVVRRLVSELGLDRSTRLLDLAAGTGQLTRLLLPLVGSVVAIDPSEPMRTVLSRQVPDAVVLDGEAARLPLAGDSVDAIVVGEAFHWFCDEPAVREMARVLRPGGGLALLWNVQLGVDPPWPDELASLVRRHRGAAVPAGRRYDSGLWRAALEQGGHFQPLSSMSARHVQHLDADGFVAQIASWSYIAALPEPVREHVLDVARRLAPRTCATTFRTDLHWTRGQPVSRGR